MKLPVPLCKSSGAGPPRCPSFYNNFEVVDLQAFRTAEQWAFFLLAERSHAFLCEAFPGRTRPGKCGGGGMGDAIFRTLQVNTFLTPAEVLGLRATVSYHHPAPIAVLRGLRRRADGRSARLNDRAARLGNRRITAVGASARLGLAAGLALAEHERVVLELAFERLGLAEQRHVRGRRGLGLLLL